MREAELKRTVEEYLQIAQNQGRLIFNRQNSGEVLVKRGSRYYRLNLCQTGTPDYIVHKEGKTFYLEIKGDKTRVTKGQQIFASALRALGIPVYVIKSFDDLEAVLK